MDKRKLIIDDLFEDKDLNQNIVKSFYSKDELSSDIFEKEDNSYVMNPNIREKLLEITDSFADFIDIPFFIYDVILTGSLANYNWSEYSDIDLHILIDMNEGDFPKPFFVILKEFFNSKKEIWNKTHDIKIKNYDVEIYVQDISEKHVSSGVYSILNNKWVIYPEPGKEGIDEEQIIGKAEEYADLIDNVINKSNDGEDVTNEINDIKDKIKKVRQTGLERGGEYSYENLAFKLLRRNGYIEKLLNLKKSVGDKKLSVTQ